MLTAARPLQAERTHWYTVDGKPMHDVTSKTGTLRPATLRDARKLGLYPSVTNVLRVLSKGPQLQNFLIEQACLAVLTGVRLPEETLDAYVKRVLPDMDEEKNKAADFGTRVHAGISDILENKASLADVDEDVRGCVDAALATLRTYMAENELAIDRVEDVLVGDGYAGTVDLVMSGPDGLVVFDWKTKRTAGRKPTAYDDWAIQLGGYAKCLSNDQDDPITLVNCIVSVDELGVCHIIEHEGPWHGHYKAFKAAFELWCYKNSYNPRETCE